MAGFDLGVLPIGDWSIEITLSIYSVPEISEKANGLVLLEYNLFKSFGNNVWLTSVDFPDPETPVTHINLPNGN